MEATLTTEPNFDKLPRFEKRQFVPEGACLTDKEQVLPLFKELLKRNISSSLELKTWVKDRSELEAAFDQEGIILYIRMTSQTDDLKRAADYKQFVETVAPQVEILVDQLNWKYIKLFERSPLDPHYYAIYNRVLKSDIGLFRQDNVPLETQLHLLSQEYQKVCGAMSVPFRNEEYTLPQMAKFLFEQDRNLRAAAFRAAAHRRLQDKERLEDIFDKMVKLRHQIAEQADCKDFSEFQFRHYHRFDYTPEDCKIFHSTIERCVTPLLKEIFQRRKAQMRLGDLRPWDLAVDPSGRPPLKPFQHVDHLISGVTEMLSRTDSELGLEFQDIAEMRLMDLTSRKGKAPGGYQQTLAEARKPFIFMNAVGLDQDVMTLLHEAGHAFHALAAASQFLYSYRHAPMEFCEVASMGMELLAGDFISVFYNPEDARRSRISHFEDILETLAWVATIDAFQFWIYEHPTHPRKERIQAWLAIRRRFAPAIVDWRGLEEIESYLWQRQLHIFEAPFYYIEYAIAQLGTLQLWLGYRREPQKALSDFKRALSLGGSKSLPEIFETAGIKFDFSQETMIPFIKAVEEEINI